MNGLIVAGVTTAAATTAALAYAICWALKKKKLLPTVRMMLMFIVGCCASVAFGIWVVKGFALLKNFGSQVDPAVAGLIIAIPGVATLICAIFFVHSLHPKHKPEPRDETAALILPLALILGVGGTVGAVGDGLRTGTSDFAVQAAAMLVGGASHNGPSREASTRGR